jgi:NAD+ diphosphatase
VPGPSVFAFVDGRLLVIPGAEPVVPTLDQLPPGAVAAARAIGDAGVALALAEAPEGLDAIGLRELLASAPPELAAAAGRAAQIVEWELAHAYCGRCGTATTSSETELARICPSCGAVYYPRISPAVIMLVEREGRVLLGRRPDREFYSVLAGFVEPGETLEETVRREVLEEVGVEVGGVRYFGSQPWPFPSQLMIGFVAEAESDELVVDATELAEAGWYGPDELPPVPGPFTIARWLIDDFVARSQTRTGS